MLDSLGLLSVMYCTMAHAAKVMYVLPCGCTG